MNSDSKACMKTILGHPCHLRNGEVTLKVDRKTPKKPDLALTFTNASGEESRFVYVGGRDDSNVAFKISHMKSHGNYNAPQLGLNGDGGQFGNPALEAARRKIVYQENHGGDLSCLNDTLLDQFQAILVKKDNQDYVRTVLPSLAKKMESEEYTEDIGKAFLDSYKDMNGEFFTSITTREYKDQKSNSYTFATNVFTNSYDEEKSKSSYPKNGTLFGVENAELGIDAAFMKKKEYRPPKMFDMSSVPIPDATFDLLKENGLSLLPIAIYGSIRPSVVFEKSKLNVKFYLDTALVPIENKRLQSAGIVDQLKSGGVSSEQPAGDAFGFVRPKTPHVKRSPETEQEVTSKRAKGSDTEPENESEEESGGEGEQGVGQF